MIKVASLFAGVGGICQAFKDLGCEITYANEFDEKACQTYRSIYQEKYGEECKFLEHKDVREVDASSLPDFNILTGGFPCQSFSIAGERKGLGDDRGNLFFEIERILREKKPDAFLLENVKNLAGHDNGKTLGIILSVLDGLGYSVKCQVLNSMKHGNIPQNRERIFIIGFLDENKTNLFSFPDEIPLTKTIRDIIDKDRKEDRYYYGEGCHYTKYNDRLHLIKNPNTVYQIRRGMYIRDNKQNVCPTLTANMGSGGHNVPLIIDNFGIRKLTPNECFAFQGFDNFNKPEGMSDGHLYKQAGNSVTIDVVKRIAENMIEVL